MYVWSCSNHIDQQVLFQYLLLLPIYCMLSLSLSVMLLNKGRLK
jgi:hypothetical protein